MASTPYFGTIEYDGKEKFSTYLERFEIFLECNSIGEEKKKPVFLTAIGAQLYTLLLNLCVPEKPRTKTYDELKEILLNHLEPKTSIIAERYKFNQRVQNFNESIADYLTELKKLSIQCQYGEKLNDMIRDRFISGLRDTKLKMRILNEQEEGMTLDRAVKMALSTEKTAQNLRDMGETDRVQKMEKKKDQSGRQERQGPVKLGGRLSGGIRNYTGRKMDSGQRWQGRDGQHGEARGEERREMQCFCCGKKGHTKSTCWWKERKCRNCGQIGHLQRVCKSTSRQYYLEEENQGISNYEDIQGAQNLFKIGTNKSCFPYVIKLIVSGRNLDMEIDTGSAVSAISYETYKRKFSDIPMQPCNLELKSYTNTSICPMGLIEVKVQYKEKNFSSHLYIFDKGASPLVGRDWLQHLNILRFHSMQLNVQNIKNDLKSRFPTVFSSELGTYKGEKVNLSLRENTNPKYYKARPIPYSMKDLIEKEINRLVDEKILTPVQSAEWASPIVSVLKDDGKLRLCGDFKVTINPYLEENKHPLPRIEDLFVNLQKGQKFSKIDLAHAYQQCLLSDESKKLVVINTHLGLFAYNRMPFGVKTAPNIFQGIMDKLFKRLEKRGVATFIDDIVVTGRDDKEHLENLMEVLSILEQVGLTVKIEKCIFMSPCIQYLGYKLSSEGIQPDDRKVEAILQAPEPRNGTELKSFLGMINYYMKFLPNASTILAPLYNLTRKDTVFNFDFKCKRAFRQIKEMLASSHVLAHYDPNSELYLACDASAYGLGAVLSQKKNGIERPIAYASRTLNDAERHYSQIDKEALALVYGVSKFNQYLWGKKFTLVTDSKPLISIFGPKKGIPVLAAGRLQRYALLLSGYNYNIIYVKSENNNADCLSRLPLQRGGNTVVPDYTYLNFMNDNSCLPIDFKLVRKETMCDPILKRVLEYVYNGWPKNVDIALQPYFNKREQLTVEQNIIMYGHRVVIPSRLIKTILDELHSAHLGIVKMKSIARSYFWWISIDKDIELLGNSCNACLQQRQNPDKVLLHPWEYPKAVWSRLHIDYLGPCFGKMYLIIQCAYSKWIEVAEVSSTSAAQAIAVLKKIFAVFGYPELICSDNGPPFHSVEFQNFIKSCGIKYVFSPAYHPQSNGAAESAVKIIKNCIKKAVWEKRNVEDSIINFLMYYRNSQHSTTGETPAQLMFKRNLRTKFDLLKPNVKFTVEQRQEKQKVYAGGREAKQYNVGQKVLVRSYRNSDKWLEGTVLRQLGPLTYLVKLINTGIIWKRHVEQMMLFESMCQGDNRDDDESGEIEVNDVMIPVKENLNLEDKNLKVNPVNIDNDSVNETVNQVNNGNDKSVMESNLTSDVMEKVKEIELSVEPPKRLSFPVNVQDERRYPKRVIKKPVKLNL